MTTTTPEHHVAADLLWRANDALTAYATYCREVGIVRPAAPLADLTLLDELTVVDAIPAPGPKDAMARIIAAGLGVEAPEPQAEAEWWSDRTRAALTAAGVLPVERECAYCGAVVAEDSPGAWMDAMDDAACEGSPTGSHTPDEAEDVASLPDCGEDFMAGTICSLPAGHVDRDGTPHGTTCRKCGTDWYHTGFCDCPPSDDELPTVHRLDADDDSPVTGFEVMPVRDDGEDTTPADEADATAWGIYVTYDGAPTMHVEDYDTQAAAERIAYALAGKYPGADWRTLPA